MKKCPYCRRRINYSVIFKNKKHGSYTCENCKKESKLKVDNKMIILFVALCLLVVIFMIIWAGAGLANNFWGVVIVCGALLGFNLATPAFMDFVPLKKYKNDTAGKNGEEKIDIDSIGDSNFVFNREAFDKFKRQKEIGIMNDKNFDVDNEIVSDSRERMVPVIEDVKEAHASSSDAPLHKINRQPKPRYESIYGEEITEPEEDVKQYTPKKKRQPEGSRYTANRRF